jgi:hypothetical protein
VALAGPDDEWDVVDPAQGQAGEFSAAHPHEAEAQHDFIP